MGNSNNYYNVNVYKIYVSGFTRAINEKYGIKPNEKKVLMERLAEQQMAELFEECKFNPSIVKNTLEIENDDISEMLFKDYMPTIKSRYLDYITY